MKNNYLHTGNTKKKSSVRARPVFRAFGVLAAVTLAGVALRVALAAGTEHVSIRSSKSQIIAENPDASNNSQARSGKNPIAERYTMRHQHVCHNTLAWLLSVSLGVSIHDRSSSKSKINTSSLVQRLTRRCSEPRTALTPGFESVETSLLTRAVADLVSR
jgi:hypothetical protein